MSKKRSIISYEKLNIEQKKELLLAFPDGFAGSMSKMNNPITGESMDALIWETEEAIYLVKIPKPKFKPVSEDDDEEIEEEELDKFDGDDDEDSVDNAKEEEEDNYGDKAEDEPEEASDEE